MVLFVFLIALLQWEGTAFASEQNEDKENRPPRSSLNYAVTSTRQEAKQFSEKYPVIVKADYTPQNYTPDGVSYIQFLFSQENHHPRYFDVDWNDLLEWPVEFDTRTYYLDRPLDCYFRVISTYRKRPIWQDTTFCGQVMPFNENERSLKAITYFLTGGFKGEVQGYY